MLDIQKRLSNSFFALLSLPATAMGFALSIQIAALSWILSTQYNLDIHDVGLVWAAGPIAGILGQVIIGIISDKVWFWNGRRRPFILIGGVLAALMLLALPNIDIISSSLGIGGILGVALLVALTLDLAINVSFNPTRSIIADVTPEGKYRTKGYTWMQTVSGTFGVLAYFIGALYGNYVLIYVGVFLVLAFSVIPPLFIHEPRELPSISDDGDVGIVTHTGFTEILRSTQPLWGYFIYSVYALTFRLAGIKLAHYYVEYVCIAITLFFIFKALLRSEDNLSKREKGEVGFKKVLAAHSFTWLGVQTMFVYMYAYVQDKIDGASDNEIGQVVNISFLIFNLVAAILPAFVLEPSAGRIGRVKTHIISIGCMALGYAGILLFGFTPILIYTFMFVTGIGWAATVSLPFAIMSHKVDQSKMGLYMGLFNLSVVLPQLVASLGIGQIVSDAENKSIIFIISSISLAISALLWMFVKDDEESFEMQSDVTTSGH